MNAQQQKVTMGMLRSAAPGIHAIERVSIIGAGLSGLTLANGLQKVGIAAKLFEAAPSLAEKNRALRSSVVCLGPQALACLQAIGLKHRFLTGSSGAAEQEPQHQRAIGGRTRIYNTLHRPYSLFPRIKNNKGHLLFAAPNDVAATAPPVFWVEQVELENLLRENLSMETSIEYGHRFVRAKATDGNLKVSASFENGAEEVSDLLVGADGTHSTVRALYYLGPASKGITAVYQQRQQFQGIATLPPTAEEEYHKMVEEGPLQYWGDARLIQVVPLSDRKVYWSAMLGFLAEHKSVFKEGSERKAALLHYFSDFEDVVPSIIDMTDDDAIVERSLYRVPHMLRWGMLRTVLVGDACHAIEPYLNEDASLAMEDAIELSHVLRNFCVLRYSDKDSRRYPKDIPRASLRRWIYSRYEEQRMGRAAKIRRLTNTWKRYHEGMFPSPSLVSRFGKWLYQNSVFWWKVFSTSLTGSGHYEVPNLEEGRAGLRKTKFWHISDKGLP
ncbi:Salicylate hydroxylase [Balamuthia mandrillaris]